MKNLLLLLIIFFTGCTSWRDLGDQIITTSESSIVFSDHNGVEPVGHFTITQARWAYTEYPGSDITLVFRNTSDETISFNFCVTGNGWRIQDAILHLKSGEEYSTKRYFLNYRSLDSWRVKLESPVVKEGKSK
jgi:hypothetical protein